jgi:hypothetical protein
MKGIFLKKGWNFRNFFIIALFASFILAQNGAIFGQCGAIILSPSTLPDGEVGVDYNATITASGSAYPPYIFSVSGGALPTGLSLSPTGAISGIAASPGLFNFIITATDGFGCTGTQSYSVTIIDLCPTITVTPLELRPGFSGIYYSQLLTASGGAEPYTFYDSPPFFKANLTSWPPGLSLSASGIISGIPTQAGVYDFDIYVYDIDDCSATLAYTLTISACPLISLSPSALHAFIPGTYFSQEISASGGTAPYTYAVTAGALPAGLSLSSDGVISGTPTDSATYNFTVTATDANQCTGINLYSGSPCSGSFGSLGGSIVILSSEGNEYYALDGPGVTGSVTATAENDDVYNADIVDGSFDFGELPYGEYALVANITYVDNIPYDAALLTSGCPSPSNGVVIKNVSSTTQIADVFCNEATSAQIEFDGPIVMLHGILDCYEKWYERDAADPDFSKYWDNYARSQGVISFTPNYEWWGDDASWLDRTNEVVEEISLDMASLTTHGIIPFVVVSHDMGGLVARVMGSPLYNDEAVVSGITNVYLLGTPNSGMDLNHTSGKNGILGPSSIIRYFNDAYPDFGRLNAYAIAGNKGWWNTLGNDGRVSLYSAFNITRMACKGNDCILYPSFTFDSGDAHVFHHRHSELGSAESVEDIFDDVILTKGKVAGSSNKHGEGVPEAPTGAVGWGTVGRSSATLGAEQGSQMKESTQDYPFTVSKCDGMAVFLTVTGGSADFKVVSPSGQEYLVADSIFLQTAPAPGTWSLRVTPGSNGVTFKADVIDNSIFGIRAYLTKEYILGNEKTVIQAEQDGDWSAVTIGTVQALIYDSSGTLLQTLTLANNGSYFSNEFGAPPAVGTYEIAVKAEGTFDGNPFSRIEFVNLNVLPQEHFFSGAFSDSPVDQNADGKYDAVSLTAGVSAPQDGHFLVSGDLFDSAGNFLSHSTAVITSGGQASLVFALKDISCSQLSAPLEVVGLKLLDADSLEAVDVWNSQVATQTYSSGQFACDPTEPAPKVLTVVPSKVVAGTVANIAAIGRNFNESAFIAFDAGIGQQLSVLKTEPMDNRVIYSTVSIPVTAVGTCNVKVVNPDGKSGTLLESLSVVADNPPQVIIQNPTDGSVVGGTEYVTAGAYDDVKISKVVFELDGAVQSTVDSFPFIWVWDTTGASSGSHVIRVTATDSSGQESVAQSNVTAVQPPVVSSISKKGNPFRFVVSGSNIQSGVVVYINDEIYTNAMWKSSSKLVIKGGSALKTVVPKGVDTSFKFVNPDKGEAIVVWRW